MKNLLKPQAIFFDMDGVLVDSLESWWKSLNTALKKFNQKSISKKKFIEDFWGHTLEENLQNLAIDIDNKDFCDTFYRNYVEDITLFSNVKNTLQKLKKYPKAIITNTPKKCTETILNNFQIRDFFKVVITSDQIKNGKPNPEMIFKACKMLHVEPENVILVGDTKNDIIAGRSAGCITIGIQTPADFTIDSMTELSTLIDTSDTQL